MISDNYTCYEAFEVNLVKRYLNGETVQWSILIEDNWDNVTPYESPEDIYRISNPSYRFRIKEKITYQYRHLALDRNNNILHYAPNGNYKANVCYIFDHDNELIGVELV
jgi:hypothetical protein